MIHALYDHNHAFCGCHHHALWECHRCNVAAQHEQKIYHFTCTTSYVIVHVFDLKLDKFKMIYKNIIIYLTKYFFYHTYVID
jgi:hypothetical protein